jgi:hypothetical protein
MSPVVSHDQPGSPPLPLKGLSDHHFAAPAWLMKAPKGNTAEYH